MFTHLALGKLPLDIHQEHLEGAGRNVFFFLNVGDKSDLYRFMMIYDDL
jgi:hypothetical protein